MAAAATASMGTAGPNIPIRGVSDRSMRTLNRKAPTVASANSSRARPITIAAYSNAHDRHRAGPASLGMADAGSSGGGNYNRRDPVTAPDEDMDAAMPPEVPRSTSNRRRSLPAEDHAKRRSANYVRSMPASPQVISSLIDSLSTISVAAQEYSDRFTEAGLSVSTPVSPLQPAFARHGYGGRRGSFGVEYNVHGHQGDDYLHPDDAAEPPVVRTSKPPSGLSPITAPKIPKGESAGSLRSYFRSSARSSFSSYSKEKEEDDASAAHAVSRRSSMASVESANSKHSGRTRRSLMLRGSRERLKNKDQDRHNGTAAAASLGARNEGVEIHVAGMHSPPLPSPRRFVSTEEPIREEPLPVPSPEQLAESSKRIDRTPLANGKGPATGAPDEPFTPDCGVIPSRRSSLRHQDIPSGKPHFRKLSPQPRDRRSSVAEEGPVAQSAPRKTEPTKEEVEAAKVTERIRELKARKKIRDRESGQVPSTLLSEPGPSTSSPRQSTGPGQSTTLGESSAQAQSTNAASSNVGPSTEPAQPTAPEQTHDTFFDEYRAQHRSSKAHKILGISSPPQSTSPVLRPLTPSQPSPVPTLPTRNPLRESRPSDDTEAAKDTAMPSRNYVETLRVLDSTEAPNLALKSFEIGEEPVRQQSLDMSPAPKARLVRANSRQKRWSQPEPAAKPERRPRNAEAHAVKPVDPPLAVAEKRPLSSGSIDDAVEAFLTAPRLSQRVKHPMSGRVISFSEVGDPDGFAVFCCVGMGLTRYITAFYDELALTLKLRLITPDRPGVGESERYADGEGTPLSWPDDILAICAALGINKFSILAHSAGAIYALATALRMPQHIRGRVHLLAPWIPPSQMTTIGLPPDAPPGGQLPKSQRFLRVLPTPFLRVANSSFMSATSASITRSVPRTPQRVKRRSGGGVTTAALYTAPNPAAAAGGRRESMMLMDRVQPTGSSRNLAASAAASPNPSTDPTASSSGAATTSTTTTQTRPTPAGLEREVLFDTRLTMAIWDAATTNANPALDLLVCLERTQAIGFRYVDINRAVVIHHGSRDSRVPVENVRWLGRTMRKCDVRVLEGEGHGLMANAVVMGNVLTEMAREWEDWMVVTGQQQQAQAKLKQRQR